jgi:hypothetical protein
MMQPETNTGLLVVMVEFDSVRMRSNLVLVAPNFWGHEYQSTKNNISYK